MFEFDKYDPKRPGARTAPRERYQPYTGVKRRAFLLWGEHCIECAAPDCFSTCDLYDPRPDERCRRFVYGIYRNTAYPSAHGFAAEVIFKQWGKIEARGNAAMLSAGLCTAMERGILAGLPMVNFAGRCIRRMGGEIRWSYVAFGALERLNRWLRARRDPKSRPDAFLAEIYNPGTSAVGMTFIVAVDRGRIRRSVSADQVPAPYSQLLTIQPGFNRFDIPASKFLPILESGLPFNFSLIPDRGEGGHLVFLSLDLVVYSEEPRSGGSGVQSPAKHAGLPAAKCVVFDLDNTLWEGVLLEGEVHLKPGVRELLAELDSRGILISLASKNSHDDAMAQMKSFDLDQYLLFPQINWNQKSKNISAIAERININLDTVIFVDDNAFEREEVVQAYPQVEVLPDSSLSSLLEHPRLKGSKTDEARQRRAMYQDAAKREEAAAGFGDDYIAFLKSCKIVVDIMPVTDEHRERVIELVQRTNQLNFSGRKYGRSEISAILDDGTYDKHVIACADKFGSYGIVGFALSLAIEGGVRVEDFMLSCRVQGKFVEQALFSHLVQMCRPPARFLEINFVRTDRNGLAEAVLRRLGFDVEAASAGGRLRRELKPTDMDVDFLTIRDRAAGEVESSV